MDWFAKEDDNDALAGARKTDRTLQRATDCLFRLYDALWHRTDDLAVVIEILRDHESQISELQQINKEADRLGWVDYWMFDMQNAINEESHQITGLLNDLNWALIPFNRLVELSRDPRQLQFIGPGQTLKATSSPARTLRDILEGQSDADAYKKSC